MSLRTIAAFTIIIAIHTIYRSESRSTRDEAEGPAWRESLFLFSVVCSSLRPSGTARRGGLSSPSVLPYRPAQRKRRRHHTILATSIRFRKNHDLFAIRLKLLPVFSMCCSISNSECRLEIRIKPDRFNGSQAGSRMARGLGLPLSQALYTRASPRSQLLSNGVLRA